MSHEAMNRKSNKILNKASLLACSLYYLCPMNDDIRIRTHTVSHFMLVFSRPDISNFLCPVCNFLYERRYSCQCALHSLLKAKAGLIRYLSCLCLVTPTAVVLRLLHRACLDRSYDEKHPGHMGSLITFKVQFLLLLLFPSFEILCQGDYIEYDIVDDESGLEAYETTYEDIQSDAVTTVKTHPPPDDSEPEETPSTIRESGEVSYFETSVPLTVGAQGTILLLVLGALSVIYTSFSFQTTSKRQLVEKFKTALTGRSFPLLETLTSEHSFLLDSADGKKAMFMLELELFREDGRLKVPGDTELLDTYIERARDVGADAQDLTELIACREAVTRQQDAAAKTLEDFAAAEETSADESVSVEGGGVSSLVSAQRHDEGTGNVSIAVPVGPPALAHIGTADFRRQGSMQLEEEILQNCQLANVDPNSTAGQRIADNVSRMAHVAFQIQVENVLHERRDSLKEKNEKKRHQEKLRQEASIAEETMRQQKANHALRVKQHEQKMLRKHREIVERREKEEYELDLSYFYFCLTAGLYILFAVLAFRFKGRLFDKLAPEEDRGWWGKFGFGIFPEWVGIEQFKLMVAFLLSILLSKLDSKLALLPVVAIIYHWFGEELSGIHRRASGYVCWYGVIASLLYHVLPMLLPSKDTSITMVGIDVRPILFRVLAPCFLLYLATHFSFEIVCGLDIVCTEDVYSTAKTLVLYVIGMGNEEAVSSEVFSTT